MTEGLVYLDYPASTPPDPRVVEVVCHAMTSHFGNPANLTHRWGREARALVEEAADHTAAFLGASVEELTWTSGATEGNNLLVKGVSRWQRPDWQSRGQLLTLATAHRSLLAAAEEAAASEAGLSHAQLAVDDEGRVQEDAFARVLGSHTRLVSLMAANNETGRVHDVASLAGMAHKVGAFVHCDATQAAGKRPIDVGRWGVDSLVVSGHKMYGPKGVGVLFLRRCHRDVRPGLPALFSGDSPFSSLRPGTLDVPSICGMGEACRIASLSVAEESARIESLTERLWVLLSQQLNGCHRWCAQGPHIPGVLSLAFEDVEASVLLGRLQDLALSTGAACHGQARTPSHVLQAMAVPDELLWCTLRIGLGRPTSLEDVVYAAARIVEEVRFVRSIGV